MNRKPVHLRYADVLWVNRLSQGGRGRRRATIPRKSDLERLGRPPRGLWLCSL